MLAYGKLLRWQFAPPVLLLTPLSLLLLKQRRAWLLTLMLCLVMYTFILTAGMNPDLDIQTLFIARVNWIPSYAILAILIGFGLTHLLVFAARHNRFVFCLACIAAILLSFAPLEANFDPEFVKHFGGSEQSGFGE